MLAVLRQLPNGGRMTAKEDEMGCTKEKIAEMEEAEARTSAVDPLVIPLSSPALKHQSDSYPASWYGKVPLRVKMAKTVTADTPFLAKPEAVGHTGREYFAWVNSHGAVAIVCDNGEKLGVKPYEFEVTEWH